MAQIVNLGYEPEEVVTIGRIGLKKNDVQIKDKTAKLIDDYRNRVMADIKVLTTTI
jgi:hypothetical protein